MIDRQFERDGDSYRSLMSRPLDVTLEEMRARAEARAAARDAHAALVATLVQGWPR